MKVLSQNNKWFRLTYQISSKTSCLEDNRFPSLLWGLHQTTTTNKSLPSSYTTPAYHQEAEDAIHFALFVFLANRFPAVLFICLSMFLLLQFRSTLKYSLLFKSIYKPFFFLFFCHWKLIDLNSWPGVDFSPTFIWSTFYRTSLFTSICNRHNGDYKRTTKCRIGESSSNSDLLYYVPCRTNACGKHINRRKLKTEGRKYTMENKENGISVQQ